MKTLIDLNFSHEKYPSEKIKDSLANIFSSNKLMSIASINKDQSWINVAFYAFNNHLQLFFLTEIDAQHSKNLLANSSVAVSIFNSNQPWGPGKLQGLQLFGTCSKAEGIRLIEGGKLYIERFPDATKYLGKPNDLLDALLGSWIYVIYPQKIKILDELVFGEDTYVTIDINRPQ